jgi:hypothetical protein
MKDLTEGALDKALEFAKTIGDASLQSCLDRLKKVEENYLEGGEKIETDIVTDFAPYSFYFMRYKEGEKWFSNGGIIFHGKHDNGGDGGAPTFSVCLTPCNGWQIHT